jgi:hypothetical protein
MNDTYIKEGMICVLVNVHVGNFMTAVTAEAAVARAAATSCPEVETRRARSSSGWVVITLRRAGK